MGVSLFSICAIYIKKSHLAIHTYSEPPHIPTHDHPTFYPPTCTHTQVVDSAVKEHKHADSSLSSEVQCVVVCCSVLQCVAVCCSVLQCVGGWQLIVF